MQIRLLSLLLVSGSLWAASPSNKELGDQIDQLKRLIQARGTAQINLQLQLTELQDELSLLRGETEKHAHKLEQIIDRQRELYVEIERRLASVETSGNAVMPTVTPTVETDSASTTFASAPLTENQAYDQAVNLILKDRKYDEAIPEFQRFIQNYPQSVFIANAHFWLGQLLFNKAEYEQAKQHFDTVIRGYPDSNKRAEAIYKQAIVHQRLGQESSARSLFQQVIDEYPDSTSANSARSKLATNE